MGLLFLTKEPLSHTCAGIKALLVTDRSFLRLFGVRNRVYLVENAQNHAVVLDLRGNDMSVQFDPTLLPSLGVEQFAWHLLIHLDGK